MTLRAEAGHTLHVIHCEAALPSCNFNPTHNLIACATCACRATTLSDRVADGQVVRHYLDKSLFPNNYPQPLPATLAELMALTYDGVNIGRGAASSAISLLRDYGLDVHGKHRSVVELALCTALGALLNYQRILSQVKPDEVIIFNGRHAELRPMVELCQQRKIPFICHERGGNIHLYQTFVNSLPHGIATRKRMIRQLWDEAGPEREAKAVAWLKSKRLGTNTDDRSYVGGMELGNLPQGWDGRRHNIVVFNSSEDEMQSIAEWKTPLFDHQNEVILRLAERLRDRHDVTLYVRMHPNLATIDNQQTKELRAFQQANFRLIPGADDVDSYALSEAADAVLSFASTIGIEATYWGGNSVLYGPSFYEDEGAVYTPRSFDELVELLTRPGLPPKPKEATYRYAYFMAHNGLPYQYATIHAANDATILGQRVRGFPKRALTKLPGYLAQRLNRWRESHRIVTGRPLRLTEANKLYSHLKRR